MKNSRKSELLCFSSDLLEIWYRGYFEMIITKSKPRLKLENDSSKKFQFSTDFSQNYKKHSSTILRCQGNSGCLMRLVCIHNESLEVYSKSHKVYMLPKYSLPFQNSRGKTQPVGGFRLMPFGDEKVSEFSGFPPTSVSYFTRFLNRSRLFCALFRDC